MSADLVAVVRELAAAIRAIGEKIDEQTKLIVDEQIRRQEMARAVKAGARKAKAAA